MRDLGTYSLVATLILALGAAWLLALGAWSERKDLIRYGYYAVYGFFLTTVIASAVLLQAFLKGDFSFAYVVENSDTSLSVFYRIAGFWAGQSGSFLLWLLCLAIAVDRDRRDRPQPAGAAHRRRRRRARRHLGRVRRAHDLRQRLQPVPRGRSGRHAVRPQPAAPPPGHGAAPAGPVHRLRRPRRAVRLRRQHAAARPRRQALGAALAEVGRVRLALPLPGHRPRRLVGLRRAQLRRLLGLGRRSRTPRSSPGSRRPPCSTPSRSTRRAACSSAGRSAWPPRPSSSPSSPPGRRAPASSARCTRSAATRCSSGSSRPSWS